MAERHSWASQQVSGVGVQTVEDVRHSMGALWFPASGITNRSGLVPSGTTSAPGSVLATTPTPNTFGHVQPFRFVLQSNRGGGVYVMCLDAIKDIDYLNPGNGGTAADPSNARIDLIIAQQNDVYFGDANSDMVVKRVSGTPSGSPVDPTVTGSSDYVVLSRTTVPAGATTIQTANIANVALPTAVTVGGLLPVGTSTVRDALTNPYDGMQVYRRDTDWIETYDGTAWRTPDLVKTSALANITAPATGQLALLVSTAQLYRWSGSAWVPALGTMGSHRPTASVTGSGTTEKVGCFVTYSAITGRRYKATWNADLSSSNANGAASIATLLGTNPVIFRLRVKAGTDGTAVDGTLIDVRDAGGLSNAYNIQCNLTADWVSTITGTVTLALTFAAGAGATGNVTQAYGASSHTPKLIVEDIGV